MKQVLLFHSNALNADAIGDLLAMIQGRGYALVTLDEALKDPAYAPFAGEDGGLAAQGHAHRWSHDMPAAPS